MTFSQNLKYLRELNHVTQEELAHFLKVTRSTIAGYETKGKQPDYEKLIKIASYFHVSVDFLLGYTRQNEEILPDYLVTRKISEHEFNTSFRKLSKLSRQKLWDYMELLKLSDQKIKEDTVKKDKEE